MAATSVGLDAASAALLADQLLSEGETLQAVWRYVIVQLLDDYSHDLNRSGVSVASRRFDREHTDRLVVSPWHRAWRPG